MGGRIHSVRPYVTRTVSDGGDPELVFVTQRRAANTLVDTALFHVNAVNGEDGGKLQRRSRLKRRKSSSSNTIQFFQTILIVFSYNYEVANVQRIVTAPALLESKGLVFVFMFPTRVAPSNTFDVLSKNFHKVQRMFTVSRLSLTRPIEEKA
ncbi:uncharacterized protein LACBIDRAFT_318730 [Laccaria bicolor S238N-H82]|uniref:ER membrane protein complex subunit 1 n=1 Tax=Laccaria bicolor (strain S238N-H82 / ATCC MYA-4686) TaxID=486041 RepID=B0D6X8_LACBS|nr:uncharacterized protein LACBIDRAFT_318730 [Laccaria bicolor S238N-H82]EDR09299.1 predicted protein [Laccaria bicolor S238N-H82]|eukprot:XP_001879648.1 predicted protein [Laccaria bicolor S238N-H82]